MCRRKRTKNRFLVATVRATEDEQSSVPPLPELQVLVRMGRRMGAEIFC